VDVSPALASLSLDDLPIEDGTQAWKLLKPWETPTTSLRDYLFLKERVIDEHGWEVERAEGAIVEYLRFMRLVAEAPRIELVASMDVDLVWHEHIIDTLSYQADSSRLWGRFMHHKRARTPSEVSEIPEGYERTKRQYLAHFGAEPPARFWGSEIATSMCGGGGGLTPEGGPVNGTGESKVASPASNPSSSVTSSSHQPTHHIAGFAALALSALAAF